ncbi:DHH family phosphoesterase [Desulfospira joergensenii]|uniref:DHH family phosphoesterase n=1 Tax=Desulfospira joergensenii TaxID=53329 RepID=UPI0003B6BDB6|nr:DHH family phosphoesterase [Desulfospira joergensenii]
MPQSINQYLLSAKIDINDKPIDLMVMGNEAADLDSMASAIAFAYIRSQVEPDKNIVPLMPIVKEDFKLRTEAVYVFKTAQIDLDNLIFLDKMPQSFMERVNNLAIVDHNKLSGTFEDYGDKIRIILDHHKEEGLYKGAERRVIEPVGSTATLVGEILIREHARLMHTQLATLLTGTILLDTVNLDPAAGRVTEKDSEIAVKLMEYFPLDPNNYFREVQKAKFDTAGLSTIDLLRKDYKEFKFNGISCGISSVLLSMAQWTNKDNELCLGFETYASRRNLDVLLSMNAYTNPDFNRDLAVYCRDAAIHDKLISFLQEKGLDLKDLSFEGQKPCLEGKLTFYSQANLGISRKKLSPMMDELFTN